MSIAPFGAPPDDHKRNGHLPDQWASPLEVAEYLDNNRHEGFDLSRLGIIRFCRDQGYGKKKGFKVKDVVTGVEMRQTRRGFGPIKESVWDWAGLENREEYCPRYPCKMDIRTGRFFTFGAPCESAFCPKCARIRAEDDMLWACWVFKKHQRIRHAIVQWDKGLLARLRTRRSRSRAETGTFWLLRADTGMVHIYSSADLPGTVQPRAGLWLPTDVALERLVRHTLALPGPQRRRFNGSWKRPTKPREKRRTFDLGTPPREVVTAAEIEAERELRRLHGLERSDLTSELVASIWRDLVQIAMEEQWEIYKNERGGGRP